MSKLIVVAILLVACLYFVSSATIRESKILDAYTAINKIIAEYNRRYPGPSKVHPAEVATLIDPNYFRLN